MTREFLYREVIPLVTLVLMVANLAMQLLRKQ